MATDNSTFKRKKRPSGSSYQLSLEEHIARLDDNPHPQYARKVDIETIKAGITVVQKIEDVQSTIPSSQVVFNINSRIDSNEAAIALLVTEERCNELYAVINHDHNDTYSLIDHDHNNMYSVIGHDHDSVYVKLEDLELGHYVTRSELSSTGIYPSTAKTEPSTDFKYIKTSGIFENNVNYYLAGDDEGDYTLYDQYVVTSDDEFIAGKTYYVYNEDTGEYNKTSDVVMDSDTVYYESQYLIGDTIPSDLQLFIEYEESFFDFNSYTTQGQYYIQPSVGVIYKNNPDGITEGLLYVNTCEVIAYDDTVEGIAGKTSIVQQLISSLGTYKRNIIIESTNTPVEETLYVETEDTEFQSGTIYYIYDEDSDSYVQTMDSTMQPGTTYYIAELSTSLSRSDKIIYGEWIFLNDNNPIGSLLFMTCNVVPAGYIEANGASYFKDTYSTLWKFVCDCTNSGGEYDSSLVLEDMKYANLGCYGYIGPVSVSTLPSSSSTSANDYIGGYIALSDGRLHRIESIEEYTAIEGYFQNDTVERAKYLFVGDSNIFSEVGADTKPDSTKVYFKQVRYDNINNSISGTVYQQVYPNVNGTDLPETIPTATDEYDKYYTCTNISSLKPILITKVDVDDVKNKFSVPELTDKYIRMWASNSESRNGSYLEAGLPNITGTLNGLYTTYYDDDIAGTTTGAFTRMNAKGNATKILNYDNYGLGFDASRSNSIYGNSDTVTPESINIHVLIKAYQGSIIPPDTDITSIEDLVSDKVASIGEATTSTKGMVRLATTEDVVNKTTGAVAVTPTALSDQNYVKSVVFNGNTIIPNKHIVDLGTAAPTIGNRNHQVAAVGLNDSATGSATYTEWTITDTNVVNADVSLMEVRIALRANSAYNALGYPAGCIVNNPLCVCKNQDDSEYLCTPQLDVYKTSVDGVTQVRVRLHWPLLWYLREFNNTSSNTYPLYKPTEGESPSVASVAAQLSFWDVIVNLKY